MTRAADLLGPSGPFAASMARYEARPGQLEMTAGVERALGDERIFICEAGTGTGKTLAYLVPAILSGRKVVVSTATRALQEQVFTKDIPLVAEVLGIDPRAALVKGLGNYLCLRRFEQFRGSAEASSPSNSHKLAVVSDWRGDTESGDLGELAALAETDPVVSAIQSSSDTRVGAGCRYFDECFVTRMKRDAEDARLVVVNHHLFFADLALRGPHPGRVLPDYDAVIFDEAHQLEDIATAFFSVRVSKARFEHLVREVERGAGACSGGGGLSGDDAGRLAAQVRDAESRLFEVIVARSRANEGRVRIEQDFWSGDVLSHYHRLDSALEGMASAGRALASQLAGGGSGGRGAALALSDAFEVAARRAQSLRDDLATIVEGAPGRITWAETGGRSPSLSSSPVDVSETFRDRVFDRIGGVVLTSATLASGRMDARDPFSYVKARLGLTDDVTTPVEQLVVQSPFDYEQRSLLYLPDDLPEPSDPAFFDAACARTVDLVEMTDGGVFVLSTSVRMMRALARALGRRVADRRILVQGDSPKAALLSSFRADRRAVLVATMSFWQGVDVPGSALRLVVIDKIPFPVPTDPIVQARGQQIEAAGKNAFMDLAVPAAKIVLKQGFGRLIRTRDDDGVVALLDARVHRRGYGKRVLSGLPPAARATCLDDVRAFWRRREGGAIR